MSDVKTYTSDCRCEEGANLFAYIFPDEFGHVCLCNEYMHVEKSGTGQLAIANFSSGIIMRTVISISRRIVHGWFGCNLFAMSISLGYNIHDEKK